MCRRVNELYLRNHRPVIEGYPCLFCQITPAPRLLCAGRARWLAVDQRLSVIEHHHLSVFGFDFQMTQPGAGFRRAPMHTAQRRRVLADQSLRQGEARFLPSHLLELGREYRHRLPQQCQHITVRILEMSQTATPGLPGGWTEKLHSALDERRVG